MNPFEYSYSQVTIEKIAVETRMDVAAAGSEATPPVNVTVSAMDSFIPTIPNDNPEGID